jgi:predicted P-loop ATPase
MPASPEALSNVVSMAMIEADMSIEVDGVVAGAKKEAGAAANTAALDKVWSKDFRERVATLDPGQCGAVMARLKRALGKDLSVPDYKRAITFTAKADNALGWRDHLIANRDGSPKALLANAISALRSAPEWAGVLAYDEFAVRTLRQKPAPWGGEAGPWTDADDIRTAEWLQHHGITINTGVASEAVQAVAQEGAFHPVRDWLNALVWDGKPRTEIWLPQYFGTPDTAYTRAIGSKWLTSAVARVMKPGCQADCCLILEGAQGLRKSSALRIMAGDAWFTDQIADLHDKQASQDIQGKWIIEFGELAAMGRSEAGVLKSFLTRRFDHFRPPYGRRSMDFPRQCVYSASTNLQAYLVDETGARRFWPTTCTKIDLDAITADRAQLWAEARVHYEDGDLWWLNESELVKAATAEQCDRYEADVWQDRIAAWLKAPCARRDDKGHPVADLSSSANSVNVDDVLSHSIGKRVDLWTQGDKARVGRCLKALGWVRYNARTGDEREWRYRPGDKKVTTQAGDKGDGFRS